MLTQSPHNALIVNKNKGERYEITEEEYNGIHYVNLRVKWLTKDGVWQFYKEGKKSIPITVAALEGVINGLTQMRNRMRPND